MDWVRQLGTFPTEWKVIIHSCSKPPIRKYIYIYIILYSNIYRQATRVFSPIFGAWVKISPGYQLHSVDTALLQDHDFIVWYGFWCRRLRSTRVRCKKGDMEKKWLYNGIQYGLEFMKFMNMWKLIYIYKYIYTYIIAICINMPIDFLCSEILILHPQNHH